MSEREKKDLFSPQFQREIRYESVAHSPIVIAQCTGRLLKLFNQGALENNMEPAAYYLQGYTIPYLAAAKNGCEEFDGQILYRGKETGTEVAEAFDHANIVFLSMPDLRWKGVLLGNSSKKGMLAPPTNKEKFIERVDELEREIKKIILGETKPRTPFRDSVSLLRMYVFFKTALNIQLPELVSQKDLDLIFAQKIIRRQKDIERLLIEVPVFLGPEEAGSQEEHDRRTLLAIEDIRHAIETVEQRKRNKG